MTQSFPDALVEGWEGVEGSIELPDPDDRHVVAAALIGRADVIVTDNTKDFPAEQLPAPLFTQTLDEFLLDSLDLHPAAVISAVVRVADRTGRNGPRLTPADVADFLAATSAPAFGAAVKLALSSLIWGAQSASSPQEVRLRFVVVNGSQHIAAGQHVPTVTKGQKGIRGTASASTSDGPPNRSKNGLWRAYRASGPHEVR
jgi:hypothetical protein